MPESAEDLYARITAQVGQDGRLPVPSVSQWDVFPWEGELRTKVVAPPLTEEAPRTGVDGVDCFRCGNPDQGVIWRNDRWLVSAPDRPSGLPIVLFLMTHEHMDFTDMDDELASEYGRLSVWLTRIIEAMPNIGRAQACKWGDGSEHLHAWFFACTARMGQVRGSYAAEWDEILPPASEEIWRADLAHVARRLANHDGKALV